MAGKQVYSVDEVVKAIRGSSGVKATIAKRLGCHWHTVDNYLERYVTVRQAYEDECRTTDDFAESVVIFNIKLALKEQETLKKPVDSSDAKWWLERRRRDKFSTRQEVTGADGGAIEHTVTGLDSLLKKVWDAGD